MGLEFRACGLGSRDGLRMYYWGLEKHTGALRIKKGLRVDFMWSYGGSGLLVAGWV